MLCMSRKYSWSKSCQNIWIIVNIIEFVLLLGVDSGETTTQNIIRKDGYCVMYGEQTIPLAGKKINKEFNKRAPVISEKGYRVLKQECPYLAKEPNNTRACCDYDQLISLKTRMKLAIPLLSRCPSCLKNFFLLWCDFTCSPNQSTFLSYTTQMFGLSHYYVTSSFSTGLYKSCENVAFQGGKIMDYMCGTTAKDCTAKKFLKFCGMPWNDQGQSPFRITFHVDEKVENVTNNDNKMTACNESFYEENTGRTRFGCSCQDCASSCVAPPSPPLPQRQVYVMGMPLYYFIAGLCLIIWIVLFLGFSICLSIRLAKKGQVDFEKNVKSLATPPSSYTTDGVMLCDETTKDEGCYTRFSTKSEIYIESIFRSWGTWCANRPYIVIVCSLIVILVCSLGLLKFTVITNPVDLWSSPSSEARIQKVFFDENFTPFYRTSQVIITSSIERPVETYKVYPKMSPKNFSGIMYKNILDEVLTLQLDLMNVTAEHNGKPVKLQDICLQPLSPDNNECAVFSLLQYWQLDQTRLDKCRDMMDWECDGSSRAEDWHDQVMGCSRNPSSLSNGQFLKLPCMSKFGAPMPTELILGGYEGDDYTNAKSLIITIPIVNHKDEENNKEAIAWEKAYIGFLKKWEKEKGPGLNLSISYTAEYAMQDEIGRASESDYTTILLSYSLMFLYIAVALGQYKSPSRIMVDAKVTVGIVGVLIVLMSVAAALGIGSYFGLQATLIIIEVIPFLVLAVGVDNIFILVHELQRDKRQDGETIPEQVGRVLGVVGPSMLLCSFSESVAFAFGALSQMPAVHTFAALAAIAVAVNFLLQITVLIAVLSLDAERRSLNKYDLLYCFGIDKGDTSNDEGCYPGGIVYHLTKNVYAPFLMLNPVRVLVVISFSIYLCCSICMIPNINIGISQTIALPADSFLHNYYSNMSVYLKSGAPVYFVVKDGIDYSNVSNQNLVCNSAGCNSNSLVSSIFSSSLISNYSKIAVPASSWIDDYFNWIDPKSKCCRILNYTTHEEMINNKIVQVRTFSNTSTFCPSTANDTWHCYSCLDKRDAGTRPTSDTFREFLPWYLEDNPNEICSKGGHAAYGNAVKLNEPSNRHNRFFVNTSYFMAYHSVCRSAGEFTDAMRYARELSANISRTIGHDVFPYSIFYVFYEQYLTIWEDTCKNLLTCLLGIFVVTFLLLGLNIRSALCVTVTVSMIVGNVMGLMYLWNISLNAVSLVNLVMAVGISVEFCSHVVRAFSTSQCTSRVKKAEDALGRVGSSVLSGITITKFVGVFVLMFAESQLFEVYYFRMYTGIIVNGALHGLVFLPVLLSYIGPANWAATKGDTQRSTVIENFGADGLKLSIIEPK